MPNLSPTAEEQAEMVRLYREERLSFVAISKLTYWSPTAVRNAIIRAGVPIRSRWHANHRHRQLPQSEITRILELYETGMSLHEVADALGMPYGTVQGRLKAHAPDAVRPRGRTKPQSSEKIAAAARLGWARRRARVASGT